MYTIKQAAARTGLSIPTIRAWERRYGVVSPIRTPAGYRLYDDAAIERLTAMRALVESDGWRPSQAAGRIATPGLDLAALAGRQLPTDSGGDDRPAPRPIAAAAPIEAFVAAAKVLDIDRLERILDEAFAAQRFELAMDAVIFPALRAVGVAWAAGDLDVGAEHGASETVRRRLAHFFDAARGPMMHVQVLVGMPPAGQHELGAFAFAIACRRAGLSVAYLGMDVPLASWLRMARETAVPGVVFGAVTSDDAAAVNRVVEAIRNMDRAPVCFIGGPASADARIVSEAVRLPSALDEAVAVVAAAVVTDDVRTSR